MRFDVGASIRAADGGRAAGGTAAVLLHTGKRMIARKRCGVGGTGFRTCCAGSSAGTRGARRLHAGKRMIALKRIAGTGFRTLTRRRVASRRCPAPPTLWPCGAIAATGIPGCAATTPAPLSLRRVAGRRNGRMAMIVVERQRRIFRRHLHVLRLLRRRWHMVLIGGGNLLAVSPAPSYRRCRHCSSRWSCC